MDDREFSKVEKMLHEKLRESKKSLGRRIQWVLLAGALVSVVVFGAWNVLWTLLVMLAAVAVFSVVKFVVWGWTEKRLRCDVEAGRLRRAACWDQLSDVCDWCVSLASLSAVVVAVFALSGKYDVPLFVKWLCVAGMCELPHVFNNNIQEYNWRSFLFWKQWTLLATIAASVFLPIGPLAGLAAQAVVYAGVIPFACMAKRKSIAEKVERYRKKCASGGGSYNEHEQSWVVRAVKSLFEGLHVSWGPAAVCAVSLVSGLAGMLVYGRFWAIALALLAAVLGYFSFFFLQLLDEEAVKRGIDVDLFKARQQWRAIVLLVALVSASVVVMWMGGRDLYLLAALSALVLGACNLYICFKDDDPSRDGDPLIIVVYAIALGSVCALRSYGCQWWMCLLPLPAISCLLSIFRYRFPRSGLRGAAYRAAIAEIPAKMAADIRSESEKAREAKAEKRRIRNERRMANFRRSRGQ